MKNKSISKKRQIIANKIKSLFIFSLAISASLGLVIYATKSGNLEYSSFLVIIAAILLVFFGLFALRRYKNSSKGFVFEDERSRRILEKAAAKSFYVSLYVLIAIGYLSEGRINFQDVSQATGSAIGIMGLLFFSFWMYYNKKEI